MLDGLEVVYLDCLESPQSFRLVANAGTRAVAYRTALGKAILAHLSAERRNAVIGSLVFQAFTPKTITSPESFRAELEKIRKRGCAIDDDESVLGVRCLREMPAHKVPFTARRLAGISRSITVAMPASKYVSRPPVARRFPEGRLGSIAGQNSELALHDQVVLLDRK